MNLSTLIAVAASLTFGLLAIWFWRKLAKQRKLEKKRDDSAHMMIHELRAPLTAIKDASELMLSSKDALNRDEQGKLLHIIDTQSKLLLDQIGRILDTAKLEAGRFTVQKTMGDLRELIRERIEFFTPQAQHKKIVIKAAIEENLLRVLFDEGRIAQVLNNLLSNSLKFTGSGGTITVSAREDGRVVRVGVSDTGCGIPKQKQSQLFSKFSQINDPELGTGLGLYIVKGIVEAHGGSVSVASEVGKGTTVSFTLPTSSSKS